MSKPQPPLPAKLVIGLILNEKDLISSILKTLVDKFGEIDLISPWSSFDFTSYYNSEMGTPLFRKVIVFKKLIKQVDLAKIKTETNLFEEEIAVNGNRAVNIDPGYLLKERFVLATGKNFTHRIYIDLGIYADLTLIYQGNSFKTLPWSYPDYSTDDMLAFLEIVRQKYCRDLENISDFNSEI